MTVLGVKNQLVTHFLTHDTFDPERHAFEVTYDKETADFREELLRVALDELVVSGFIKKLSQGEKSLWVLVQPITSWVQQIVISPIVADMMANTVNFHNGLDGSKHIVDKTKIDELVIMRLIDIISEYDDELIEEVQIAPETDGPKVRK